MNLAATAFDLFSVPTSSTDIEYLFRPIANLHLRTVFQLGPNLISELANREREKYLPLEKGWKNNDAVFLESLRTLEIGEHSRFFQLLAKL